MTDKRNELRNEAGGRAVHDVGGLDFGPVDMTDHDLAFWERRIDAMLVLLATKKGAFKIDAMRRVIESYGEQEYDSTTYFEKWTRALRNLLIEQNIITPEELAEKLAEARAELRAAGRDVAADDVPWNEGVWNEEALKT